MSVTPLPRPRIPQQLRGMSEGVSRQMNYFGKSKSRMDNPSRQNFQWEEVIVCVHCLMVLGYGTKRIMRTTGLPKRTAARYIATLKSSMPAMECAKANLSVINKPINPVTYAPKRRFDQHLKHWQKWIIANEARFSKAVDRCFNESMDYFSTNLTKRERDAKRIRDRHRERWANEPAFRILGRLRRRLRTFIKGGKSCTMLSLVGCGQAELIRHIESQLKDGMSWDNAGSWHVDHIVPCSLFDLTDISHRKQCFNWKNLRPLWSHDNHAKSDNIDRTVIDKAKEIGFELTHSHTLIAC